MIQEVEELNQKLLRINLNCNIENKQKKIDWCNFYVNEFRKLADTKINHIGSHIANNCDLLLQRKKEELNKLETSKFKSVGLDAQNREKPDLYFMDCQKDMKYGMWINSFESKGPRFSAINFTELNIQAEVPRTMYASKLIMQVLWTSYDYLSQKVWSPDMTVGGILN